MPGWQQLEADHARDSGTDSARRQILVALPPGTPLADARSALIAAGATCRQPPPRRPDAELCLIHQYSLADDAADDVRWTVTLATAQGQVQDIAVACAVDRHGTS